MYDGHCLRHQLSNQNSKPVLSKVSEIFDDERITWKAEVALYSVRGILTSGIPTSRNRCYCVSAQPT